MSRGLDSDEVPPRCETVQPDSTHTDTDIELVVDSAITLREPRESDADELYRLVDSNRGHLGKWFAWVEQQMSVADTLKYIVRARARSRRGNGLTFNIEVSGRMIGRISLTMTDETGRQARMGYWIAAEGEGRGIMARSCRKVLEHGFENLGLDGVVLLADWDNLRSRRLAERLGFVEVGKGSYGELKASFHPDAALGPDPGPDVAMVLYSLAAADWQ